MKLGNPVKGIGNLVSELTGQSRGYDIASKNLNLQAQTLDWQKGIQERIFEREDTAVQRRKRDLEAAGLSPTLAAGSAASSGPAIAVNAPQEAPLPGADLLGTAMKIMSLISMKTNIDKAAATAALTNEKTKITRINRKIIQDDNLPENPSLLGKIYRDLRQGLGNLFGSFQGSETSYDEWLKQQQKQQRKSSSGGW